MEFPGQPQISIFTQNSKDTRGKVFCAIIVIFGCFYNSTQKCGFSLEHWKLFMAALWGDLWMNTHSCTPLSSNNCVVIVLITWQRCFTSFKTSVGSNEVWILKFLKTLGNNLLVVAWHWLKLQNKALWMQCALCRLYEVGGNLFIVNSSILPIKRKIEEIKEKERW